MKAITDVLATADAPRSERLTAQRVFLQERPQLWRDIHEGNFPNFYFSTNNRKYVGAPRRTAIRCDFLMACKIALGPKYAKDRIADLAQRDLLFYVLRCYIGLTRRSRRHATAWPREAQWCILRLAGPCRCVRLTSNVRRRNAHRQPPSARPEHRYGLCEQHIRADRALGCTVATSRSQSTCRPASRRNFAFASEGAMLCLQSPAVPVAIKAGALMRIN
jgi:hypothetical protein